MKTSTIVARLGLTSGPAFGLAVKAGDALRKAGLDAEAVLRRALDPDRPLFSEADAVPDHVRPHLDRLRAHAEAARAAAAREASAPPPVAPRAAPAPYAAWGAALVDDAARAQMATAMRLPVAVAGALMPDAHVGYGLPIGGVLATEGAVVPYAVGVDIACFPGDTLVPTLGGRDERLGTLAAAGAPVGVWACRPDGRVVAAWATAHRTRDAAPLVEVTLDDGACVRCTPDHRFMRRDGTFCAAADLAPGTSLMPFYRQRDREGYLRVQQNDTGVLHRAHWVVARSGLLGPAPRIAGQRTVIHHRDFDPANNDPANLAFMGAADHAAYHRSLAERNGHWQSEAFEAKRRAALAAKAATPEGHAFFAERGRRNLKAYWAERYDEAKVNCAGNGARGTPYLVAKNRSAAGRARSREVAGRVYTCETCGEAVRSGLGLHNHRRWRHGYNHTVAAVRALDERAAVYCLSVPGVETFALAAGVFVHNCRMMLSVFPVDEDHLRRYRSDLRHALEKETAFGAGSGGLKRSHPVLDDRRWKDGPAILRHLKDTAAQQLGSSGGGNHFVEWGLLTPHAEVPTGPGGEAALTPGRTYLALLSHSGSRAVGFKIANQYTQTAARLRRGLPDALRHLAWLGLDEEAGQEYWTAMNLAGDFASANHHVIHKHVAKAAGLKPLLQVENHHNFAWKERHGGRDVFVHRKGATPAGRGVRGIIPGSMGDPGYLVEGLGAAASLASASHGAGRRLGRREATRTLAKADVRAYLDAAGVEVLGGGLDEAPQAYKPIAAVMDAQADLVRVLAEFRPKLVRMASDDAAY